MNGVGSSAIVGPFVALLSDSSGGAEEARTRGFAAPAFAGCAFVERMLRLRYHQVPGLSSTFTRQLNR